MTRRATPTCSREARRPPPNLRDFAASGTAPCSLHISLSLCPHHRTLVWFRIVVCFPASGQCDIHTNAVTLLSRSKFSKSSNKEGKESPKSSRKDKEREERDGSRGSPRGGHKAHRDPRAERGESRERSGREERSGKKSEKLTLELDGGSRSRPQAPLPSQPEQTKESRASRQEASSGHFTDPQLPPALPPKENPHRDPSSALLAEQNSAAMQHQQYQQQQAEPGLASTPGSPLPPGTPGTGIPKPTAHVKGQTKAVPPERTGPTTPTSSPNVNTPHQTKDYNKMVRHQSSSSTSKGSSSSSSSGAPRTASTPAGVDPNCPQEPRDPKGSLPRQKQLGRREDAVSGISVALVSPMPIPRDKDHLVTPSESGSNISESSQSNSGHSNSTSSGNSSVIYKPTSSEDDSVTDYKMGRVSRGWNCGTPPCVCVCVSLCVKTLKYLQCGRDNCIILCYNCYCTLVVSML